jgi:hypothetical protein
MAVETVSMKIKCNKCEKEAVGLKGHIGKYHKKCSGRKPTEVKSEKCGKWVTV